MGLEITDTNFETEVTKSDKPVLVDFWAPWCGPCRMMSPVIESVASNYSDKLKVGKLNVDDSPNTAREYGISAIPTLILFEAGKEKSRHIGFMQEADVSSFLEKNLGN